MYPAAAPGATSLASDTTYNKGQEDEISYKCEYKFGITEFTEIASKTVEPFDLMCPLLNQMNRLEYPLDMFFFVVQKQIETPLNIQLNVSPLHTIQLP